MSQDIREWARSNGYEVSDRGRIAAAIREEYEAANPQPEDDDAPMVLAPAGPPDEAPSGPQRPPEAPPAPTVRAEEKPPQVPKRDRLAPLKRKPGQGAPRKPLPRVSTANLFGLVYSGLGYVAARNPRGIPTARAMDLMAPVAGDVLDDLVKGTLVDRLVQPIARSGERGEKAAALVGFPLLTALVTARPEMFPVVRPAMRMSIVMALEVADQPMKRLEAKAAKFAEKFGDIDIDAMIDAVFANIDLPVMHSPDEDAAVRRAQNGE